MFHTVFERTNGNTVRLSLWCGNWQHEITKYVVCRMNFVQCSQLFVHAKQRAGNGLSCPICRLIVCVVFWLDEGTLNWSTSMILLCFTLTASHFHVLNGSLPISLSICWVLGVPAGRGGGPPPPWTPSPPSPPCPRPCPRPLEVACQAGFPRPIFNGLWA